MNDANNPEKISIIKKIFDKFNTEVFGGALIQPKFSLNIRKGSLGYIYIDDDGCYNISINWRKCGKKDYLVLGTILHEMIHMYHSFVLNIPFEDLDHGPLFESMATELEKKYRIPVI
jgi:hypothetical protein